jgi:hypothetical protein
MDGIFPITVPPLDKQSGGSLVLVVTVGGSPGGICLTGLLYLSTG